MKHYKYIVTNGCSYTQGGSMYYNANGKLKKDFIPTPQEELPIKYQVKGKGRIKLRLYHNIDYLQKTNRFSKVLSDKLNCEEINIATGGSSNDRIFRTTFDWIENNKEKIKNTLFIIGLTHWARKDLYSVNLQDYIISSEIFQDFDRIANDVNCKQEEVKQWRDFELKYLTDEDEIEKKVIRDCVLLDSLITQLNGDVIFFNGLRESNIIHPKLNFLQFDSKHYKGYDWCHFIRKHDPTWDGGHPNEQHHHQMANQLYKFIDKTFDDSKQ